MQQKVIIKGARERSFANRAGENFRVIEVNMAIPCRSQSGAEYTEEIVGSIESREGLLQRLEEYERSGRLLLATFYLHTKEALAGWQAGGWWQRCIITNFAEEV